MCLAVPMKVEKIEGKTGTAEFFGGRYEVRLDLIEDIAVGEYILVHAGFAIQKIEAEEAEETRAIFREINELYRTLPEPRNS